MPWTDTSDELASPYTTVTRILYVENPSSVDSFPIGYVPDAATLVAVRAVTDTGTVDFNLEQRSKLTPDVAGSDVWSADKQATASGLEQSTFDSPAIAADSWLHFAASAIGGGVTRLWLSLEYSIDV